MSTFRRSRNNTIINLNIFIKNINKQQKTSSRKRKVPHTRICTKCIVLTYHLFLLKHHCKLFVVIWKVMTITWKPTYTWTSFFLAALNFLTIQILQTTHVHTNKLNCFLLTFSSYFWYYVTFILNWFTYLDLMPYFFNSLIECFIFHTLFTFLVHSSATFFGIHISQKDARLSTEYLFATVLGK